MTKKEQSRAAINVWPVAGASGQVHTYIHCPTGVLRGRLNVIVCVLSLVLSNSWPQRLPLPGMEKLSLAGAGVPQRWEELQPKSEDLKIELLNELMAFVCHESCNGSCEKVMIQCVIAAGTIGPQTILLLKNWPGAPRGFFWELGEAQKGAPQYILGLILKVYKIGHSFSLGRPGTFFGSWGKPQKGAP